MQQKKSIKKQSKIPFSILRQYWKDNDVVFDSLSKSEYGFILSKKTIQPFFSLREITFSEKIVSKKRRHEWLCGRYLLKKFVASDVSPHVLYKNIEILFVAHKKPLIMVNNSVFGNDHSLSHSDDAVISVVAKTGTIKIGIDVEKIRSIPKATNYYLTGDELHSIQSMTMSSQKKNMYRYWTIKEAVLKSIGSGLTSSMKGVYVKNIEHMHPTITLSKANRDLLPRTVHSIDCSSFVIDDYAIAYAKLYS